MFMGYAQIILSTALPVADCLRAWSRHGAFCVPGHDCHSRISRPYRNHNNAAPAKHAYRPMWIELGSSSIARWTSCAVQMGPITADDAVTLWRKRPTSALASLELATC